MALNMPKILAANASLVHLEPTECVCQLQMSFSPLWELTVLSEIPQLDLGGTLYWEKKRSKGRKGGKKEEIERI